MPKIIEPTFFFIGNQRVLDYINTKIAVNREPVDLLETFTNILDWLGKAGYLTKEKVDEYEFKWTNSDERSQAVEAARELRRSLLTIIQKSINGENVPNECIEYINLFLKEQTITTKLVKTEEGFVKEQHINIQKPYDVLFAVAEDAVNFFSDDDLSLVKKCENPDCVLYFYDTSKNSTRKWCSQKTCGNRMKVAAHLERKRDKETFKNGS